METNIDNLNDFHNAINSAEVLQSQAMIKVETTQIKEGAGEIKEIVAQALIEAVNDFQLMATK